MNKRLSFGLVFLLGFIGSIYAQVLIIQSPDDDYNAAVVREIMDFAAKHEPFLDVSIYDWNNWWGENIAGMYTRDQQILRGKWIKVTGVITSVGVGNSNEVDGITERFIFYSIYASMKKFYLNTEYLGMHFIKGISDDGNMIQLEQGKNVSVDDRQNPWRVTLLGQCDNKGNLRNCVILKMSIGGKRIR